MNLLKALGVVALIGTAIVLLERANFLWPPSTKWLWAAVAWAVALAIILVWRSVAPRGTGWAPGLLILTALAAGAYWIDLGRNNWMGIAGVGGLGISLFVLAAGFRAPADSPVRPLTTVLWVHNDAYWRGPLPSATRVRVILGARTLDMSAAVLQQASKLHLTVIAGRVSLVVPDSWNTLPIKAGGPQLRFEGRTALAHLGGPPLELRLLGALGTVAVTYVNLPPDANG